MQSEHTLVDQPVTSLIDKCTWHNDEQGSRDSELYMYNIDKGQICHQNTSSDCLQLSLLQSYGSTSLNKKLNTSNLTLGAVMNQDHQIVNVNLTKQTEV